MTPKKRIILSGALSALAHLTLLYWGFWSMKLDFEFDPNIDIEFQTIEMLDPSALQQDAPQPVLPPPGPALPPPNSEKGDEAADEKTEEKKEEEKEEEKPKPKPKFGEKSSRVDRLAPSNSTFSMLLATKRIARLPFANEAAEIMAPLPDFNLIIQGGGFDVWRDFDYIVIASSDIRDLTQTFLAVQYKLPRSEMKAGLERAAKAEGLTLNWETRNGLELANPRPIDPSKRDRDPRWFVFLEDQPVGVYVRNEFLSHIQSGPDKKKAKTAGNFVANITRMRRFARREPKAGLQLQFNDIRRALAKAKAPFPLPNNLEIMAEASKRPRVAIKLEFLEESEATTFLKFWKKDLKKIINDNLMLSSFIGADYRSTEIEQDGKKLIFRNRFSTARTQFVMGLIADQARKMMRRDKKEMAKLRKEREAMAELRRKNKLTPSEVIEAKKNRASSANATEQSGKKSDPDAEKSQKGSKNQTEKAKPTQAP